MESVGVPRAVMCEPACSMIVAKFCRQISAPGSIVRSAPLLKLTDPSTKCGFVALVHVWLLVYVTLVCSEPVPATQEFTAGSVTTSGTLSFTLGLLWETATSRVVPSPLAITVALEDATPGAGDETVAMFVSATDQNEGGKP